MLREIICQLILTLLSCFNFSKYIFGKNIYKEADKSMSLGLVVEYWDSWGVDLLVAGSIPLRVKLCLGQSKPLQMNAD